MLQAARSNVSRGGLLAPLLLTSNFAINTKRLLSTESTDLSNGITVASLHNPAATTASYTVLYKGGSTLENPYNNGISNVLANHFKYNKSLNDRASKEGIALTSEVNRNNSTFTVNSLPGNTSRAISFLQENIISQNMSDAAFTESQEKTLDQLDQFESFNQNDAVLEHLHSTAFQNTPLALPVRGTVESVQNIVPSDLKDFTKKNFISNNTVIVSTGNVSHEELVQSVSKLVKPTIGAASIKPQTSSFLGSEVRLRDDTLPKAWISIAVEAEPLHSRDYFIAEVASQIFGDYNSMEPRSRLQGIKLLDNLQEYQLCDSFHHFNHSYADSGLWGFTTTTRNVTNIDDLIHFTLKQWNRLTISITETELERGKALLKLKLGMTQIKNLNNSAFFANEFVNNKGNSERMDLNRIAQRIDAITVKDIKHWAGKRLWDQDIAIAGMGQIEGLLDYMRIRNDMSMMRW